MPIAKRQILKTNLEVSSICLGTMTFGSPLVESDAIDMVHWAMDHGINFFDTANMYEGYNRSIGSSGGIAEEILGKALKDRRERAVVATKLGMKVGDQPEDEFTSPAAIRKHLDMSLRRLKMERVDIYYLHKPDPVTPMVDILAALDVAIKSGKICHYGVSNYSAQEFAHLLEVADANKLPRPVINQPAYSMINRGVENDLLPLCEKEQISVAPFHVLQAGLLTGKYRRSQPPPADSRKAEKSVWVWDLTDEVFDKIEQAEKDAHSKGRTLIEHAVLAVLEQPSVVSVLLGAKRIDQLKSLVAIVEN